MQARIKLTQHFTIASLIAFGCVAGALIHSQIRESAMTESVRNKEWHSTLEIQTLLANRAANDTHRVFLTAHETSSILQARLLSNLLWDDALAPLMLTARGVEFKRCRTMAAPEEAAPTATEACLHKAAERVQALPAFAALDKRLPVALQGSAIANVRLHDLQGTTLYAPDHSQVGDDHSGHPGWIRAARNGQAGSEFLPQVPSGTSSGMPDSRHVVVSHLPLTDPLTLKVVAVLEVHTDVTPQLDELQQASANFRQAAANEQTHLEQKRKDYRRDIKRSERMRLLLTIGLLVLLFAVLYSIVRRAQVAIERQAQESDANKQRLAQSEKLTSLGQMVASVAHQLNTPLAFSKSNVFMAIQTLDEVSPGVRKAARVLESVTACVGDTAASRPQDIDADSVRSRLSEVPDELRMTQDMLGDVLVGLNQMNELVDNLRSFTRLDRGRTAEVDLNTTLASVIYIARAVISPKIRVVEKFVPLPRLECQVSQLNQVFLNLIMNAAQAIDGSGLITVTTSAEGRRIRISIEDTGSGISDDDLPRIFDPYFTTKPAGTGTGLGLAIAKDVVDSHGGTLSVTTRVGSGTTFLIELPIPSGQAA